MNTRLIVFVSAIADAVLAAAAGLCLPLLLSAIVWFARGDTVDWASAYGAAAAAWALSLGGAVSITIEPASLPALALTQPIVFPMTLVPLGIAIAPAVLAYRSGARVRSGDGEGSPVPILLGGLCFALLIAAGLAASSAPGISIDVARAAACGMLLYLLTAALGLRAWRLLPPDAVPARLLDALPVAAVIARGAAVCLAALASAASLVLGVAVCAAMGRMLTISQSLHLDASGGVALGLGQIAYLPNAVAWVASWLVGAGFAVGTGTAYSPFGMVPAPVPLVPLLGALPGTPPVIAPAVLLIPVAAAAAGVIRMRFDAARLGFERGWRRFAWPLAAAALAACGACVAALLARGAAGPGRLAVLGPDPLAVLLASAGCFAAGALIAAAVPASLVERARELTASHKPAARSAEGAKVTKGAAAKAENRERSGSARTAAPEPRATEAARASSSAAGAPGARAGGAVPAAGSRTARPRGSGSAARQDPAAWIGEAVRARPERRDEKPAVAEGPDARATASGENPERDHGSGAKKATAGTPGAQGTAAAKPRGQGAAAGKSADGDGKSGERKSAGGDGASGGQGLAVGKPAAGGGKPGGRRPAAGKTDGETGGRKPAAGDGASGGQRSAAGKPDGEPVGRKPAAGDGASGGQRSAAGTLDGKPGARKPAAGKAAGRKPGGQEPAAGEGKPGGQEPGRPPRRRGRDRGEDDIYAGIDPFADE